MGGGGGNNLAVLSHFSSGLADCQPIFVSWPDFTGKVRNVMLREVSVI